MVHRQTLASLLRLWRRRHLAGRWQIHLYRSRRWQKRDPKGAKPGSAKVKDDRRKRLYDSNDKVIIGSKNPSFLMSMSNTLTYKNFYLSFLLNGTFKLHVSWTKPISEVGVTTYTTICIMPITGHRNTPIPNMLLQHITTSTDTAITKTLHTSK